MSPMVSQTPAPNTFFDYQYFVYNQGGLCLIKETSFTQFLEDMQLEECYQYQVEVLRSFS